MSGESTRNKIFDSATELFSEFGYSNVSMRDIAKRVGVTEGAIYRHYTGKEALLDDILDAYKMKQNHFLISNNQVNKYLENHTPRELLIYCSEYYTKEEQHFISCVYRIICQENLVRPGIIELINGHRQAHIAQSIEYVLNTLIGRGDIPALDTSSFALAWAQAKLFTAQRWASAYYDEESLEKVIKDYAIMSNWMIEVALTGKAPVQCDCEPIELIKSDS